MNEDVQAAEGAETRSERIVRLAAPLFLEHGYDQVSINDIIEVTGGSKATLYAHFGSKEGLFEAVVAMMCGRVTLGIDLSEEGPLEVQLTRIGVSFLRGVLRRENLKFHRMMVSAGRRNRVAGRLFYETGPRRAYRLIGGWIAAHQQAGRLGEGDPEALAAAFHDMILGDLQMSWLTAGCDEVSEAAMEARVGLCARVFLRGLAG